MRFVALVLMLVLAGCASGLRGSSPSSGLLTKADALAASGDFPAALAAYTEIVLRYPDDPWAPHARASVTLVDAALSARQEVARLEKDIAARDAEIARVGAELRSRERGLERLSRELAARQGELARLTQEADRLRTDFESLKRLEMRLDRRR